MTTTRKAFQSGTHRIRTPEGTLTRVTPHLAAMGITRVANVTGLDRIGIPVVNAFRPNSRSLSVSQGKGMTLQAAKASAVMEAIEGYHAEEVDLPRIKGSYNALRGQHRLIDTARLAYLHDTEFDPALPIEWYEAHDLMSDSAVLVPSELIHTDYTLPRGPNAACFVASTNGLASGNHALEAIVHGICEVIERDAHTLWELGDTDSKAATQVDLSTVTDPACREVIDRLRAADMEVGVWDMTGDVGVATFHCLITDARVEHGHSGGGAGTHPCRDIALMRALTEAVQVRTNYITGARDDLQEDEYTLDGIARKTTYAQRLMAARGHPNVRFSDIPSHIFDTLEEDLNHCLARLSSAGITEVATIDLTKPAMSIPVHRVIIPGLEGPHDHADYTPGLRARRKLHG